MDEHPPSDLDKEAATLRRLREEEEMRGASHANRDGDEHDEDDDGDAG